MFMSGTSVSDKNYLKALNDPEQKVELCATGQDVDAMFPYASLEDGAMNVTREEYENSRGQFILHNLASKPVLVSDFNIEIDGQHYMGVARNSVIPVDYKEACLTIKPLQGGAGSGGIFRMGSKRAAQQMSGVHDPNGTVGFYNAFFEEGDFDKPDKWKIVIGKEMGADTPPNVSKYLYGLDQMPIFRKVVDTILNIKVRIKKDGVKKEATDKDGNKDEIRHDRDAIIKLLKLDKMNCLKLIPVYPLANTDASKFLTDKLKIAMCKYIFSKDRKRPNDVIRYMTPVLREGAIITSALKVDDFKPDWLACVDVPTFAKHPQQHHNITIWSDSLTVNVSDGKGGSLDTDIGVKVEVKAHRGSFAAKNDKDENSKFYEKTRLGGTLFLSGWGEKFTETDRFATQPCALLHADWTDAYIRQELNNELREQDKMLGNIWNTGSFSVEISIESEKSKNANGAKLLNIMGDFKNHIPEREKLITLSTMNHLFAINDVVLVNESKTKALKEALLGYVNTCSKGVVKRPEFHSVFEDLQMDDACSNKHHILGVAWRRLANGRWVDFDLADEGDFKACMEFDVNSNGTYKDLTIYFGAWAPIFNYERGPSHGKIKKGVLGAPLKNLHTVEFLNDKGANIFQSLKSGLLFDIDPCLEDVIRQTTWVNLAKKIPMRYQNVAKFDDVMPDLKLYQLTIPAPRVVKNGYNAHIIAETVFKNRLSMSWSDIEKKLATCMDKIGFSTMQTAKGKGNVWLDASSKLRLPSYNPSVMNDDGKEYTFFDLPSLPVKIRVQGIGKSEDSSPEELEASPSTEGTASKKPAYTDSPNDKELFLGEIKQRKPRFNPNNNAYKAMFDKHFAFEHGLSPKLWNDFYETICNYLQNSEVGDCAGTEKDNLKKASFFSLREMQTRYVGSLDMKERAIYRKMVEDNIDLLRSYES